MKFAQWGHKELALYGGGPLVAGILVAVLAPEPWCWLSVPPLVFAVLTAWFFRDPHRVIPTGPGILVSPADGVVADIEEVHEPDWIGGPALRVGIFLSPLNVHVNRVPAACTVGHRAYRAGKFLAAYDRRAVEENESCALGLSCAAPGGKPPLRIVVRQVVGAAARRIVCPPKPGDRFEAGQRYGMIKFGSRTELWVPVTAGFVCRVKVGDKVVGGETIIGAAEALA
jgi:phosphatidylserine decarboxylase